MPGHTSYLPRGTCWFWDLPLTYLQSVPSLLTFLAYAVIALIALRIYLTGNIRRLDAAYPDLWMLGASFIATCGLSHLGNFLEVWVGSIYWWTGALKVVMSVSSVWFAVRFWRTRTEIALIARVLDAVARREGEEALDRTRDIAARIDPPGGVGEAG